MTMRIALCLFGKLRTLEFCCDDIYASLIDCDGCEVDVFASTWMEDGVDVEEYVCQYLDVKDLIVEREGEKIKQGIGLFGSLYPMIYKKKSAIELAAKYGEYDLFVLSRMDFSYLDKVDYGLLDRNVMYTAQGFYDYLNDNKVYFPWKSKIHPIEDYFDIYMVDSNAFSLPHRSYVNPVCDQFYIGSLDNMRQYLNMLEIMDVFIDDYNKISKKRKLMKNIIYFLFKNLPHNRIFFGLYKRISKSIGFYIPFWVPLYKDFSSLFKPTLFAYQMAFYGIQNKVINIRYRVLRSDDYEKGK